MIRLTRDIVVEVVITLDREGESRCTMSTLDRDAPARQIVEALVKGAAKVMDQAEHLAEQHGLRIDVTNQGTVKVA